MVPFKTAPPFKPCTCDVMRYLGHVALKSPTSSSFILWFLVFLGKSCKFGYKLGHLAWRSSFRHTDDTEPCCKSAKVSIEGCDRYQSSANVSSPFCKDCSNWLTSTEDTKQISQIATWNMRNIKKASKMQRHGQLPSFSFIRPHSFMDNSIPFGLHCKFPQELTQGWTQRVVDCTCPTALSTQQPYELTESTMWLNSVKLNSVWLCISAT